MTVHLRDADAIWLPGTSFGLTGIKERTESLGGRFRLTSERGRGTSVEVLLP